MTITHTNGHGAALKMLKRQKFETTPLYVQVKEAVKALITSGAYKALIPNEHELAAEFGVSDGTVRKALDVLEGEGWLERKQGRGTFVRQAGSLEDLPPSAGALINFLGGKYRPSDDPALCSMMQVTDDGELTGNAMTAGDFRIMAEGAAELASWLERRALAARKEAA